MMQCTVLTSHNKRQPTALAPHTVKPPAAATPSQESQRNRDAYVHIALAGSAFTELGGDTGVLPLISKGHFSTESHTLRSTCRVCVLCGGRADVCVVA